MARWLSFIEGISPALACRMRQAAERRAILREFNRLDPGERYRLLHDLGLSAGDEVRLAHGNLDRPDLLPRLMRKFGLNPARLAGRDAEVMHDLRRSCVMCTEAQKCARLLERHEPAGAFGFCPNAQTLGMLRKGMLGQPAA